jgi:serine/threonine protein kinase
MKEETLAQPHRSDSGTPLPPDELLPGTEVNGFRLVRYVDKGGYGCVWLAESIHRPGQYYALKFNLHPPAEDPTADARALREVQLLLQAAHPNVVGVVGYGRYQDPKSGILYIILEWVEGATLLEWTRKANPCPRQVVGLAQKLVHALQAAHEQGVMHRDVKPDNVLLREADGEPFLADFGMGETERSTPLTWGGLPPGTRHFLSPEALAFPQSGGGRPYRFQPADDWYALGVTLYQLLTEVLPFPDDKAGTAYEQEAMRRWPVPPHLLNPRVPLALSRVVMRMLAKHPRRRYRDGNVLWAALDRAPARPGHWDAPLYEPGPPPEPGQTPTQEPTPGDGPAAEDEEVAWRHALKHEDKPEEQRQAAALSRRDALLPGQPTMWPPAVRRGGAALVLVLVAMGAWVAWPPSAATPPTVQAPVQPSAPSQTPPLSPAAFPAPEFVAAPPPQPSLAAVAATAQKEGNPVKTPQSSPPRHPSSAPTRQRAAKGSNLAALCAAGVVATGCPGIPLRPAAQECPPAAVHQMRARGIRIPGPVAEVNLDVNGPSHPDSSDHDEIRLAAGQKVVTLVSGDKAWNPEGVPRDTLLFGKVIAGGQGLFFIRYEEAQFPDEAQRVPICAEAYTANNMKAGLRTGPGSTEDTFTHSNYAVVEFRLQFPGKP